MLTLTPLAITLIITYNQNVTVIKNNSAEKLKAIRDIKVEQMETWIFERLYDLQSIAKDNELMDLKDVISDTRHNEKDIDILNNIKRIMDRHKVNYEPYVDLFIINPLTGKILVSTNDQEVGKDESNKNYFKTSMKNGEPNIGEIYYSIPISNFAISFSMPITYNNGINKEIIGILVTRINLKNSLYRILLERIGLGTTGETLIVNNEGLVLNNLRWYNDAVLNLTINAEPARKASKGETGFAITNDYRDEVVLAAYTHIPATNWGFVCKQDMKELNEPVLEMLMHYLGFFIMLVLIIIFISIQISKSFSKPIILIGEAAKKIETGNFSERITIDLRDELGFLAKSFNNMASVVQSRINIQSGISNISETMIGKTSMDEFASSVIDQLRIITGANFCTFHILNEATQEYEHFESIGANKELLKPISANNPTGEIGIAIAHQNISYIKDIPEDSIFKFNTVAGEIAPKEIITIPIIVEKAVVAIISLVNINKFSSESFDTINQSWININTSYSNLIASERTSVFADHLSRINQQLEAKSEELQEQAEEMQTQAEELQHTTNELQSQNIELEEKRKQVVAANNLKSEFLSNMSHELRTPLNSILALSSVLISESKEKLTDDETNYLTIIERNGKRLLSLINDILDLSKIEAGKMDINPSPISIGQLLRLVVENIKTMADNKGLSINLDIPDNLPPAETDESRLHQVILNIISNSVKFTNKGSIDVKAVQFGDEINVTIKDTGIGISEEILPYIFDEFRQADGTSSRSYEGTGLGLAIAKKITEILGCKIHAESQVGIGTTFSINIPVNWYEDKNISQNIPSFGKDLATDNNTILVVDDDLLITNDISSFLQKAGYKTITANNGIDAIAMAKKHKPLAITLDIIMPDMDGWEVLQKLKADAEISEIPVIVVSVSTDKDTGIALGALGYVNKPVQRNLLLTQIKQIKDSPKLVMIVDDDEIDRNHIASILQSENIQTVQATGGQECCEIIEDNIPDIIVLDLLMPEFNGFEVLQYLKQDIRTINIPVIIVTAKDLTKEDKKLLTGNVSSIITKSDTSSKKLYKEIIRILQSIDQEIPKGNIKLNEDYNKDGKVSQHSSVANILIVEDNPDNMITIKAILGNKYNLFEATGGEEALKFIEVHPPNLILLDMSLPHISGKEIVSRLKSYNKTKNIPIIAVTAQAMVGDRESFINAGCDDYVPKPIDKEELKTKVSKYVGY